MEGKVVSDIIDERDLGFVTLDDLLERSAARRADEPALSFANEAPLTFAELYQRVGGFRTLLRDAGFQPGERVALMMANSLDYPVAWLAVLTAGGVAVPINKRAGTRDAGYILEHSGSSIAICDSSSIEVASEASAERRLKLHLINLDMSPATSEWSNPFDSLHAGSTANIQYTSGTTGFPKGCILTHRYWIRMGAGAAETLCLRPDDRLLTAQPHSYIDPQWNVVVSLLVGCELIILEGFHPSTFMLNVATRGVTVFYCLGVMPTLLLKQPASEFDRKHSLRGVYCSAIPPDKHAAIEARFGVPWFEVFGMTESGVNSAVSVEEHDELVGSGSIGRAVSYCEASVVDEQGTELGPGEKGELVFRGMGFMNGYFRAAAATAAFYKDGWAHTGDLAELDEQGRIYYRGRLKEMIRRGGENIAPGEIEEAIASHPRVLECAVKGVPDPDLEEEIKAYVVLTGEESVSPTDLASFLHGRLAKFKIPRFIEFRDSLPHTPSERVAKHLLEETSESWRSNTTDLNEKA